MRRVLMLVVAASSVLAACGTSNSATSLTPASLTTASASSASTTDGPPATSSAGPAISTTSANAAAVLDPDRPFDVLVPSSYDGTTPAPLVLLLHGYGITGAMEENFFHFQDLADSRGFLMVNPDGTRNADGSPFWNATDACCGFGTSVDDSAYLASVIGQVRSDYAVDPQRIFLVGFSNGGFMSHRMACDHADVIAAIVSISGAAFLDPQRCAPSEPVNVVEIHGTDDPTIEYDGGTFEGVAHPGAEQTVAQWAGHNGCSNATTVSHAARDLDRALAGNETTVMRYDQCAPGGATELWTIVGGRHVPTISSSFSEQVIDFLFAHPKPVAHRS